MQQERKEISGKANTIAGFSIPLYLGILALVVVCMYMDCLPAGLVGGMIALMVLGEGLNFLGNHTPVVKTYLGGSVICILGAAVIQALGLIPEQTHEILDNFVNKEGFLVFYISALITGSLFNIDRGLLIRATVKLLPTAVISLAVGVILSGLLVLGTDAGQILTRIAPATVLGNCVAIIFGGLANNIGERKPSLTGNGCLVNDGHEVKKQPPMKPTFALLCTGLIISMAFYELGALCHHFISIVPTYAWMIVAVVIVKGTGILSERLEDAAREWGQFAIHSWTAAALTGIGATLIDLKTILHTITPFYLLSVVLIVGAITLTAGLIGIKMGFYPLESSIAAGMCTTNMGGSGNVAVLSSSKRMELLPFAQIVTRSCGALMLTIGGVLIQLLVR